MTARAIMIQGTGSDVGKSLLVAGLARAFTRRGLRVRPFKPQNMSNNAAVTADGGEIGRAQALQARAARVPLSVHMNPVLLKPQSDVGAQVVVQGKVLGNAKAREYQGLKPKLLGAVLDSFGRLAAECDLVLVEGAGSASEVNLRKSDIANMGFARAADVPVVLVGDIDRGGVIASLVGTKTVIDAADADDDRGLHRQPLPRRSHPVRRRHEDGERAHRVARTGPGAVLRGGTSSAGRRCGDPAGPEGGKRRWPHSHRRPRLSPHRQLRRLRSAAARPWRRPRLRRTAPTSAGRRQTDHPPRIEIDHRRSRLAAAVRLGHRPQGASAARRLRAGHLRRLPDARPHDCRSARHRGTAAEGRRPRTVRGRHGARRRQGPGRGERRDHGRRRAVQGLRDAYRSHDRRRCGPCSASATARQTAR